MTKKYTAETVDWIAIYDATTRYCYYVSADELGQGRSLIHLRLDSPRNNQRAGIRYAANYRRFGSAEVSPPVAEEEVEPAGFEPAASYVQGRRSTN